MKKLNNLVLLSLLLIVLCFFSQKVFAQDNNYKTYKYETHQIAMSKTDKKDKKTTINKAKTKTNDEVLAEARRQSLAVKKKQQQLADQKLKQSAKNRLDNERNQRMFIYTIFGGILSLIVLIVGAVFFVLGAKSK